MSKMAGFIMLVEDNMDHAEITMKMLQKQRIVNKVIHFRDAESAFCYLFGDNESPDRKQYPFPSIILLDVSLPGMNGFELLQEIKGRAETRRIPVIMLTSSSRDEEISRGYEKGANSYVVKPVKFDEFRAKVEALQFYWLLTSELPQPVDAEPVMQEHSKSQ